MVPAIGRSRVFFASRSLSAVLRDRGGLVIKSQRDGPVIGVNAVDQPGR